MIDKNLITLLPTAPEVINDLVDAINALPAASFSKATTVARATNSGNVVAQLNLVIDALKAAGLMA